MGEAKYVYKPGVTAWDLNKKADAPIHTSAGEPMGSAENNRMPMEPVIENGKKKFHYWQNSLVNRKHWENVEVEWKKDMLDDIYKISATCNKDTGQFHGIVRKVRENGEIFE